MRTALKIAVIVQKLFRTVLCFSACNLLAGALSAQCTSVSQVPNQTITSGTTCYSNNDTLTAAGVTIAGSANVNFVAGHTVHLTPGFRATAPNGGSPQTTFHAWVETAPSNVSVSPASGSGLNQLFTFKASSPSGYADISEMYLLFNTTISGSDGCFVAYFGNAIYLADNSGTNWLGGFAPGSAGAASNSYCSISGSGASVSGSGTQLSITVPITFQSVFAGAKNEYVLAYDYQAMNSGWQQMGAWTVPGTPVGPDFSLASPQDTQQVVSNVPLNLTYTINATPLNGFTSPVSFSASAMFGCSTPVFTPAVVSGPPWRTTVSMSCYEPPYWNGYYTTVQAFGGNKSRQLNLFLFVTPQQQYLLSTSVNPVGAGAIAGGGWYSAGVQVSVTAAANAGYQFAGFSGSLTGGSPGYVLMNGNKSVTANFTPQQSTVTQTITTSPVTGLSLTVDGVLCSSPCIFRWAAGTVHSITSPDQQSPSSGTRFVFTGWTDNGGLSHTVTASSSSATWTANFNTQYYLTTAADTGGTISPASGWYASGAQLQASASSVSGYSFTGFRGALLGTVTPQNLTMTGPKTIVAGFSSGSGFILSAIPDQTAVRGAAGSPTAIQSVTTYGGFNQNVSFSYSNWPAGISATFNPATVSPGGSTTIKFTVAAGTAPGKYTVALAASGGGIQQAQPVGVTVVNADWVVGGFFAALDDGSVYPFFTSYFVGPDADLLSSRIASASYVSPSGQRSGAQASGWQTGSTPATVSLATLSLPSNGFGTYRFLMDVDCCQTNSYRTLQADTAGSYPTPAIEGPLSPNATAPGSQIVVNISGYGLGTYDQGITGYRGVTSVNVIGSGGLTATLLEPQSAGDTLTGTTVQAKIDAGNANPGRYDISLTAFGYTTNSLPFYVYDTTPYVSNVTLLNTATLAPMDTLAPGGQAIAVISGANFGAPPGGGIRVCTTGSTPCISSEVSPAGPPSWSDSEIRVLLSASAASSGTYDIEVTSLGLSGTFFQSPAGQSSARGQVLVGSISLSLRRIDLTHIQATAVPSAGGFLTSVKQISGQNPVLINPFINDGSGTVTIELKNPPNTTRTGAPTPGGLAQVGITFQAPSGASQTRQFLVPTFGLSCYYTTMEQEWGSSPSNCGSITIRGTRYSGTMTNPPGNLQGTYCTAFLQNVRLQGSGVLADAITKIHYLSGGWSTTDKITGSDLTDVIPDQTVARDRSIIGGRSSVRVALDGLGSNLLANDVGGAIQDYRLDLYRGVGRGVCTGYPNPIVVGACSPGSSTCPGSGLQ